MSQGLGPAFDRAQARYDAMMPPDEEIYLRDCERCGKQFETGGFDKRICDECKEKDE